LLAEEIEGIEYYKGKFIKATGIYWGLTVPQAIVPEPRNMGLI
jgi:hypothetical protein